MSRNRSYPSEADVKRRIIAAVCSLYGYDRELLEANVNERSISHKLAEHLQTEFPEWNVDCEYKRRGYEPKRLQLERWHARPDDIKAKTIFPDIIIHHRLTDENLAVIEVKKTHGQAETKDIQKLELFTKTKQYRYKYGLLLQIALDCPSELRLYKNGCEQAPWTEDLLNALRELGYGR